MSKNNQIILIAVIVIVAGGLFWWSNKPSTPVKQNIATTTPGAYVDVSKGSTTTKDYSLTVEPATKPATIPALYPPVNKNPSLPSDAAARLISINADLGAKLKANPNQPSLWLGLGANRKILGDYTGARDAWVYVGVLAPNNYLSFANLGDLYTNFLPDYSAAKLAFETAVKNDPSQVDVYYSLYSLERYKLHDDTGAKATLQQGIAANPGTSQNLKNLLANYDKAQ